MKKILRNALLLSAISTCALGQTVIEGVDYKFTLKWNKATSKHDTVSFEKQLYKFSSTDTSVYELNSKAYNYYPGGIYDQKSYFKLYSTKGVKIANINAGVFFDSTVSYNPNANGTLDWAKFAMLKSTFSNGKPVESITKIDFSAYGLGVIDYMKASYHDISAGVYSVANSTLYPKPTPGDSTVYMKNGSYDTSAVKWSYNTSSKTFEKKSKTVWMFTNSGKQSGSIDYNYDMASGIYVPTKKQEKTYPSNFIDVQKSYTYNFSTKNWVLNSVDSTYKSANGNTDVTKSYSMVNSVLEYTEKKVKVAAFNFVESSPKPAAPSNLTISASILRTESPLATTKYTLNWKDNSYNETKFEIYRKEANSPAAATAIGTVGANITTYQDATVDAAKSYEYYVVAANGDLKSDFSNTSKTTVLGIVDELGFASTLKLYPNPTQNTWTLSGVQAAERIVVRSVEGRVILEQKNTSSIDASYLEPGQYFMTIEFNDGSKVTKSVVKQ